MPLGLIFLSSLLVITNILTLWWAFKKRLPNNEEIRQLASAIKSFERSHRSILKIEMMDPEQFFYRNPGRLN